MSDILFLENLNPLNTIFAKSIDEFEKTKEIFPKKGETAKINSREMRFFEREN